MLTTPGSWGTSAHVVQEDWGPDGKNMSLHIWWQISHRNSLPGLSLGQRTRNPTGESSLGCHVPTSYFSSGNLEGGGLRDSRMMVVQPRGALG